MIFAKLCVFFWMKNTEKSTQKTLDFTEINY